MFVSRIGHSAHTTAPTCALITSRFSTSRPCKNVLAELGKRLNPREIIEQRRKEYEDKYGDKLKRKATAEGVRDLEELKRKVMAPSVRQALKVQKAKRELVDEEPPKQALTKLAPPDQGKKEQAKGDRAGIKPLSSILNLPLLHLTPHDTNAISRIWTAYHSAHPTLSSSFLSASLSSTIYTQMLSLARQNPFFVLPLPRDTKDPTTGQVKTDEYEMFYLQWLFHPTSSTSAPPSTDVVPKPLPLTASVIFTPLEEYKKAGEWAEPHLVLTHYPEMSQSHDLVLMRGEITAATASGPVGSLANPGFLLSQQQAQLLALALQRFYCAGITPKGESERDRIERVKRVEALRGFREKPKEWSWEGLVSMAYAGLV